MLQVFDEIREILQKHKEKMPVVATAELLAVIEQECEWRRLKSSEFDYMDSKHGFLEEYTTGWKFCPYCGKPIKILEVE